MRKAIYILGGMGPQASAELYLKLIRKSQTSYSAKQNDDYPEVVIHSIPVPDFLSNETTKNQAVIILEQIVEQISHEKYGVFAIACNTAHLLAHSLQQKTAVPFISIVDSVVSAVESKNIKQVGLLCSPITMKFGLYKNALGKRNINVITPDNHQVIVVEKIIRNVIAGNLHLDDKAMLSNISKTLTQRGAQGVIVGCTELPLLLDASSDPSMFDSLDILADNILKFHYTREKI